MAKELYIHAGNNPAYDKELKLLCVNILIDIIVLGKVLSLMSIESQVRIRKSIENAIALLFENVWQGKKSRSRHCLSNSQGKEKG